MAQYTASLKVNGRYVNPWRSFQGLPSFSALLKFAFLEKDLSAIPSQEVIKIAFLHIE
jgi:hypothetical protein